MRFLVVPALALFSLACGPAALAGSTFEGDSEGWTLSNNGGLTAPTLEREGGNPAGHICGKDEGDGDIWYFVAPQKFLGNNSSAMGKRLTFDLKQGNIYNQVRGRDVVLNGGGLAVTWFLRFAPGLDWTPYSVRFDDTSNWRIDEPSGPGANATEDELRTVLSDLRSLRIRGEYFDGLNDTACIDNVYLGETEVGAYECTMCGACCVAPDIAALDKPLGLRCPHLGADNLCTVYENRPAVCRSYAADELCKQIEAPTLEERVAKYLAHFDLTEEAREVRLSGATSRKR